MPLIADNILVYLIRNIIRLYREWRSRRWPTAKGRVESSRAERGSYPSAEMEYTYLIGDKSYFGTHSRAFFSDRSAELYASRFEKGGELIVRYRPDQPEISLMQLEEQVGLRGEGDYS